MRSHGGPVAFDGWAAVSGSTLEVRGRARYPNAFSTATLEAIDAGTRPPRTRAFRLVFHRDKEPFCDLDLIGPVTYYDRSPGNRWLKVVRVFVTPERYEDIAVQHR